MAVIKDYLAWRGDLSFDSSPFNEVDNYIVAKIGTPDLTGYETSMFGGVLPSICHASSPMAITLFLSNTATASLSLYIMPLAF